MRYQGHRRIDREGVGVICSPPDRLFFVYPTDDVLTEGILDRLRRDHHLELLPGSYSLGVCRQWDGKFFLKFDQTFDGEILIDILRIEYQTKDILDWFGICEVISGYNHLGRLFQILSRV